ncbi:hypothetical protein [Nonomuraea sp. CA-141351]|uniref:hypothetical protein n=1 Tax=Nonomuraea sp. CA-141351 TaxID=3239996 RepID=UPI003D8D1F45
MEPRELRAFVAVRPDALSRLEWVAFPRSGSPAWLDEVTAILRSHGLALGPAAPEGQALVPEVKPAMVSAGQAFAPAQVVGGFREPGL